MPIVPRVLVLRAAGVNCDLETARAFELAGAHSERIHLNRILETPSLLDEFQIFALSGGFSYGDDISAGKILALQLGHQLGDALREFVSKKKPILGICNGFQVLIKTGLLPGPIAGRTGQSATLTHNTSGQFLDRWLTFQARSKKCLWTKGLEQLELPIAHAEGRFIPTDDSVRQALWNNDQIALTYATENPTGSTDAIAGVCDSSGLILGLMPHPERFVTRYQHYAWTSRSVRSEEGDGLNLFRNAVRLFQ
ncbi:MAG TPA: phosphoribosylformylglycinamidine synthase subunit PurQ [Tepidisphaeraceae bacterium]|nr:phosphoribosylformylglycinamidine synthase subunit PurQ [Tepidisphaeraceae bacterium]